MKLAPRLLAPLIIVALSAAITVGVAVRSSITLQAEIAQQQVTSTQLVTIREIISLIRLIQRDLLQMVEETEEDKLNELAQDMVTARARMAELLQTLRSISTETEVAQLGLFNTTIQVFFAEMRKAQDMALKNLKLEAYELTKGVAERSVKDATTIAERFATEKEEANKAALDDVMHQQDTARITVIATAALGIGLAMIASLLIVIGSVTRPLKRVTASMQRLAAGDLTVDLPPSRRKDEIGVLIDAMRVFKDNAQRMRDMEEERQRSAEDAERSRKAMLQSLAGAFESKVAGVIGTVSQAARALLSNAENLNGAADTTLKESAEAAQAAERASANVQTVAAAAEELTAAINEIGRQIDQSSAMAGKAVGVLDATNAAVTELNLAASRIGDVVQLIGSIAAQTNLLALNATIEAARAGEAGRGFAVVAQEVKNLANQTASATEDVTRQIQAMQGATGNVVGAMEGIGEIIRSITANTTDIAAAIEQQGAATAEIARNVQEAADGTNTVNSSITSVNRAAEQTGSAANAMRSAAETLTDQSHRLETEVDTFVREIRTA